MKCEFESLSVGETDQLDDFYLKLNGPVTKIRVLGEDVQESYVVKKLLRAISSKFLQTVSTIKQFGSIETMSVEEAVGSLQAHEERMKGQTEGGGGHLLLTEEEWSKRENNDGKLLLTREEWVKRNRKGNSDGSYNKKNCGKDGGRWVRVRSRVRCYYCYGYGHYAAECQKPKKEKEQKAEVNMAQVEDYEPALLINECDKLKEDVMMLNEERVVPKLNQKIDE